MVAYVGAPDAGGEAFVLLQGVCLPCIILGGAFSAAMVFYAAHEKRCYFFGSVVNWSSTKQPQQMNGNTKPSPRMVAENLKKPDYAGRYA